MMIQSSPIELVLHIRGRDVGVLKSKLRTPDDALAHFGTAGFECCRRGHVQRSRASAGLITC